MQNKLNTLNPNFSEKMLLSTFRLNRNEISNLDIETVEELIITMKIHEDKYNDEGKFKEATSVKEKIDKLVTYKEYLTSKKSNDNINAKKEQMKVEQLDAISRFNAIYDEMFKRLVVDLQQDELDLTKAHKEDMEAKKEELQNLLPQHPKPSSELINKIRMLDSLKRQKK